MDPSNHRELSLFLIHYFSSSSLGPQYISCCMCVRGLLNTFCTASVIVNFPWSYDTIRYQEKKPPCFCLNHQARFFEKYWFIWPANVFVASISILVRRFIAAFCCSQPVYWKRPKKDNFPCIGSNTPLLIMCTKSYFYTVFFQKIEI